MKTIVKLACLTCILLLVATASTVNAQDDRAGTTSDRRDNQTVRADRADAAVRADQQDGRDNTEDVLATDILTTRQSNGGIGTADQGDAFDVPSSGLASDRAIGITSSRGMSSDERKHVQAVRSCVSQLKNAKSDSETVALTDKIRDSLEGLFTARTNRRQKEIDALQARIEDLRRLNQQREANRKQLIDLKLNTIVNEAKGIGF